MPFWPFKRSDPEPLSPTALRDKLIEMAGTKSRRKLRAMCKTYKHQVAGNLDVMSKLPDGASTEDSSIERYSQCLIAVAQCLATECGAPELWNRLCGNPEDNPLLRWDRWYGELSTRMKNLEYEVLIEESRTFIEQVKTLRGATARLNEIYLYGRLGELLFHAGRVAESIMPFQVALDLCKETNDIEGQRTYLQNLLEAHCYLDDGMAVAVATKLLELCQKHGLPADAIQKRTGHLRGGVPLCRVVCVRDGRELELDEIVNAGEGKYQFEFRRNRFSLCKATTLTDQGKQLAATGQLADALDKFQQASDVDPYDPDPVYQSGMCLMELGAYGQAREAYEEVERLAPGWFRCRTDRWLAQGLEDGSISEVEFRLVRTLEDGGLDAKQAQSIAEQAVQKFPHFAPLRLLQGDLCQQLGDQDAAGIAYRKGLELVDEPDLETRLLCALAGLLPRESPERKDLLERAVKLHGSLVAQAMARLVSVMPK